jgi:hypothetical protein
MIVKILSSSATFAGIAYNTDKISTNRGELMLVKNFSALQGLTDLRPEDYRNYLKMISATNKAVKKPQFHAVISAEGRTFDKYQLAAIAVDWMAKMGYAEQPYLVVFHKDTNNNHVHMVSTRVDRNGKKINSGFENVRSLQNLSLVLGVDEQHHAEKDVANATAYSFETKAQWMMILESQGYKIREENGRFQVIKFGRVQTKTNVAGIMEQLGKVPDDKERQAQLRAIFYKYAAKYDTETFIAHMKTKHGISILFHAKEGKLPYGYSIIDHPHKIVYKGRHIMPIATLLSLNAAGAHTDVREEPPQLIYENASSAARRDFYQSLLRAAMYNYPDIRQGLNHAGIQIYRKDDSYYLVDHRDKVFMALDQVLEETALKTVLQEFARSGELEAEVNLQHHSIPAPIIAPSVDDEAINGRNRRRKKHPRTNSR